MGRYIMTPQDLALLLAGALNESSRQLSIEYRVRMTKLKEKKPTPSRIELNIVRHT